MDINQLHEKASDCFAEGKAEEAIELYNKVLELVPNDEAAISALMDIYQDTNRVKYYITRANYNIANGKLEYAINDCKKALGLEAENLEAREKLARLYRITNKPLKAIDEFSKIIEINDEHYPSYIELIDLYTKEDALESAINIALKAEEKFRGRSNFNDILAKLYFDNGDYKKALEVVMDEALKVKILLQDEQNEAAKEILDKINIEGAEGEQKALYYLLWAQYCYNTKDFDGAFGNIDKYAEILGPNALAFQMRALCFEEKGDDFMAAYNFGFMNKALNKPDDALVEFLNAYTLNPKNKDVLIELARAYEGNGERYTAIDFWQKVYDLDGDETARSILADFYLKEGDVAMAERFGANSGKEETKALDDIPLEEDEGILNKLINFFSKK